jgi:CheY-like chemotaxis protein
VNRYADELEKRAAELEQEANQPIAQPVAPQAVTHQQQQVQQHQATDPPPDPPKPKP